MKRYNKKAQFFLLAAVIISAIVLSLGMTANHARVTKNPTKLSDYTFNVKREVGSVIDYEVYSDIEGGADISNFVGILAEDMRDKDPTLNFLFVYGNTQKMVIRNYGSKTVTAGGEPIPGAGYQIKSEIKDGNFDIVNPNDYKEYEDNWYKEYKYDFGGNVPKMINISVSGYDFTFEPSKYNQVIFIVQKEGSNETYIEVK